MGGLCFCFLLLRLEFLKVLFSLFPLPVRMLLCYGTKMARIEKLECYFYFFVFIAPPYCNGKEGETGYTNIRFLLVSFAVNVIFCCQSSAPLSLFIGHSGPPLWVSGIVFS
jgi:hypothetical protein